MTKRFVYCYWLYSLVSLLPPCVPGPPFALWPLPLSASCVSIWHVYGYKTFKNARRSRPSAERCSWDPALHCRHSDSRWRHSVHVTECRHRATADHLQCNAGSIQHESSRREHHFPQVQVVTRPEEPLSCRALPMIQLCWPESRHHSHDFQCYRRLDSEHPHEEPGHRRSVLADDRSFMIGGPTIEPSSSECLNSAYASPMMRQAQEKHRSPLRIERYTRSDITTVAQCGRGPIRCE